MQQEFRGKPLNPAVISTFLRVFLLCNAKIEGRHHERWCEATILESQGRWEDWDEFNMQDCAKDRRNIPARSLL